MTNTAEPFDHANEADVAEQQTPATAGGTTISPPEVSPDEANVADVLEQGATVSADDEQAYPHATEEDAE
jgi:hypothetical protein